MAEAKHEYEHDAERRERITLGKRQVADDFSVHDGVGRREE